MAYEKVYSRINWENEPSTKSPINEENLNKMDFALNEIDNRTVELSGYESIVIDYSNQAKTSATNALSSETKAKTSEQNAYSYEQSALAFKNQAEGFKNEAETHANNASDSEINAKASEDNASASELLAKISEENASESASSASRSSENASGFAESAETSAQNAKASEDIAVASASSAKTDSDLARSYTVGTHGEVRENDDTDNAKYYYEQTKGLVAGSVTGVKGEAEEEFRDGNVIITKENLGLGNVENKSAQEIISEIGNATESSDGLMSKEDKVKLDGIEDIKPIYDFETEEQATTGEALTDGKLHIVDDGEDFGDIPINASMIPYRDDKSVADELVSLNNNFSTKIINKYLAHDETLIIKFERYNTCALLVIGTDLYIYSNGYLIPVKSSSNFSVDLASDYTTITVKNNNLQNNYHIGVLTFASVGVSIT